MKITIKCPKCGADINIKMLKNACVAVAKCKKCGAQLCTKEGECCVICSYSEKKCREMI